MKIFYRLNGIYSICVDILGMLWMPKTCRDIRKMLHQQENMQLKMLILDLLVHSACLNLDFQHTNQNCSSAFYTTVVLICTRGSVRQTVRSVTNLTLGSMWGSCFHPGSFQMFNIILQGPLKIYKQEVHNLYIMGSLTFT